MYIKTLAKLGSDLKKTNAITVISEDNFREKIWPLLVSDLLYVGNATARKLMMLNILTIGALANSDPNLIHKKLGRYPRHPSVQVAGMPLTICR